MQQNPSLIIFGLVAALAATTVTIIFLASRDSASATAIPVAPVTNNGKPSGGTPMVEIDHGIHLQKIASPTEPDSQEKPGIVAATPPAETSIDQRIADLKSKADAGDLDAACQLVTALDYCSAISNFSLHEEQWAVDLLAKSGLEEKEFAHRSEWLAAMLAKQQKQVTACDGLMPEVRYTTMPYLLALAEQGDSAAALRFARGMSPMEAVSHPESTELYRQYGWDVFQQAFQGGEPQAGMLWARAMEGRSTLATVLPPDWRDRETALALGQRIETELGILTRPETQFTPTPAAAARAHELFQRYFANAPAMQRAATAMADIGNSHSSDSNNSLVSILDSRFRHLQQAGEECDIDGKFGRL